MLRLVLCLCVCILLLPTASRGQQSVTVDALAFARASIATGNYDAARSVLDALVASDPASVEPNFLLAELDAAEGKLPQAIDRFRRLLLDHPNLIRVRLDYALTLYRAQDDENAEYNFGLALAADLPEAVRDNVLHYLHAIRERRRLRLSVAASVAPDSNINNGTALNAITLFGLPFTPSETLQQKSGVGATVTLSGDYRYPLSDEIRWRSDATLWRTDYPGGKFDDMIFRTELGPQWLLSNWDLSALGVYTQRWYGNDPYYAGGGPRFEAAYHGFARWRIETDIEDLRLRFHSAAFENGDYLAANLYPNFALTPTAILRPILGAARQGAANPAFANTAGRFGLGYHQEFPHAITIELQGQVFLSYYDAPNTIFGTTRRDQTVELQASVYRRDWIIFGFNPVLTYIFTRNASNQPLFAYRRSEVKIGFTKEF